MAVEATDELSVKVESPASVIWEGKASAVSSVNSVGPFDILPDHANMITLVEGVPIQVVTGGQERAFTSSRAVISVHENTVSIYADIGTAPASTQSEPLDTKPPRRED